MAYNFVAGDRDQLLLMPPSLAEWLPADHLAWFVLDVVGELDLAAFVAAYRADGRGGAAYDPSMMVALLVYAYCVGERSSRVIERRCTEDVAFRVIAANQVPDHATIARFRATHQDALAAIVRSGAAVVCAGGTDPGGAVGDRRDTHAGERVVATRTEPRSSSRRRSWTTRRASTPKRMNVSVTRGVMSCRRTGRVRAGGHVSGRCWTNSKPTPRNIRMRRSSRDALRSKRRPDDGCGAGNRSPTRSTAVTKAGEPHRSGQSGHARTRRLGPGLQRPGSRDRRAVHRRGGGDQRRQRRRTVRAHGRGNAKRISAPPARVHGCGPWLPTRAIGARTTSPRRASRRSSRRARRTTSTADPCRGCNAAKCSHAWNEVSSRSLTPRPSWARSIPHRSAAVRSTSRTTANTGGRDDRQTRDTARRRLYKKRCRDDRAHLRTDQTQPRHQTLRPPRPRARSTANGSSSRPHTTS